MAVAVERAVEMAVEWAVEMAVERAVEMAVARAVTVLKALAMTVTVLKAVAGGVARAVARATTTVVTVAAVLMAALAAVVGDNCNKDNNGSGVDGDGNDGGYGDGECDGGSSGDGDSNPSVKATKTMVATAMAVGEIQQSTKKGTTNTAMVTETATVIDSNDNNVNASANGCPSTTAMRMTCSGCALRWWRRRQCQ